MEFLNKYGHSSVVYFLYIFHILTILQKQAEAEVVPSSSLVKIEVEVEVELIKSYTRNRLE